MTARYVVGDVFEVMAGMPDGSVDLVLTSPPFLALRSYLPADHPNKSKEIGSESTPAEFIDTMLRVTAELRRVLAPHGSLCVELGDTYAGSGGAGGDYSGNGWRDGQERFGGSGRLARYSDQRGNPDGMRDTTFSGANTRSGGGPGWPLAKSKSMIPELYRIALAYGINPLTGEESPAGTWRVRNVVTWVRPNPPVGALGDKFRPATSDLVIATLAKDRYFDLDAVREPPKTNDQRTFVYETEPAHGAFTPDNPNTSWRTTNPAGAPPLDWWEIPPGGYKGSHYAVWPPELLVRPIKAMCPERVCRTCGKPSRRVAGEDWTDCGHNNWRPGVVLDPFAGSGTTLMVATGHGRDAIGIDLDARNAALARERVGMFLEVEGED